MTVSTRPVTHARVLGLAIPIALANLTQPLLAAVDTAMAGHMADTSAIGGVALGGVFFNFVFWGFGFLRMGTTGLVAQAWGARKLEDLRDNLWRAMLLALAIGVAILLLRGPLIGFTIQLLGGTYTVQADAITYTHARIWSAPLVLANFVVLGYLLGVQRVRQALALQLWVNLVNVVAVLLFVRQWQWGIAGIGYATACADLAGFLAGLAVLARLLPRGLPPLRLAHLLHAAPLKRLALINRDIFLRTMLLLGSFGWFAHAGARQGDVILAANALLMNFQTFMAYGLDGLAHAVEALTGEAIGARQRDMLIRAIRISALWSGMLALVFTLVYAIAGNDIVVLLTNQEPIRTAAAQFLPWAVLMPVVSVWGFLMDGVYIGATRTRDLRLCMFVCTACFLLLAVLLQEAWGNHGLWLAMTLFMGLRGVTLGWRLPKLLRAVQPAPVG
ncbi:MATE family multidrug resistance protein [Silvimonas terrae]|uniref:MATE family multidrug resistance protein n=1 Tax=Silvimonas terrae TaxID=300266 RepID=A0A840RI28_9NEIS|nr:MATE family efflux transporter [Silvimonas terrae]MBB5192757.1 MATE family multidrug resistance protein [Silvimonas terrae]